VCLALDVEQDERQIRGLFRGYRPDAVTANEREADRLAVAFEKVRPSAGSASPGRAASV